MKAFLVALLLSSLLLAGCSGSGTGGKVPATDAQGRYVIHMTSSNQFSPAAAQVPRGAVVVWHHDGGAPHDVHSRDDATIDSGATGGLSEGKEYQHAFNETGTFTYFCHVHEGSGMKGTIVVE